MAYEDEIKKMADRLKAMRKMEYEEFAKHRDILDDEISSVASRFGKDAKSVTEDVIKGEGSKKIICMDEGGYIYDKRNDNL